MAVAQRCNVRRKVFVFLFGFATACTTSIHKQSSKAAPETLPEPMVAEDKKAAVPATTISFLWPLEGTPRVASFFGWRKKGRHGERMHEGVDLGGKLGQKVMASSGGRVIDIAYVRGYGRTVVIYHGGGWSTLYAHLWKYKVKRGQEVKAGDVVGLMGHTGHAEANHLHFEIRKGADPLDPLLFLPSRELERYSPKNFYPEEELQ